MDKKNHREASIKGSRAGVRHELKIRKMLEADGWFVTKWGNNVDLDTKTFVQAKSNRFRARSTGFPDFLVFRKVGEYYEVRFVEAKLRGYHGLKKVEKEKIKVIEAMGFVVDVL